MSSASLPMFEQDNRVSVKAIQVTSKSFYFKSTTSLATGDVNIHKSFLVRSRGVLNWELNSPLVLAPNEPLYISWKPKGKPESSIEVSLPYDRIVAHLLDGKYEYEVEHENGTITTLFESNSVIELARKRKSVLSRLGTSAQALDTVLKFSEAIGEIHPAIKVALICINGFFDILKSQDAGNNDLVDLASDLASFIELTFGVQQLSTPYIKSAIVEMSELFKGVGELISKRANRGSIGEVKVLVLSEDRQAIGQLKENMKKSKEKFDRGLQMQNAINIANLEMTLKQYVSRQDDEEFIRKLDRNVKAESLRKRCLEGTRGDVLRAIHDWLADLQRANIMWMYGYPGAGKSTVAAHFANQLRQLQRLCIVFPFDRNVLTEPVDLWCSVAYELARRYLVCREIIVSKLKNGLMNLANATAQDVFDELVVPPLRRLLESDLAIPRDCLPVFVIDALDECGGLSGTRALTTRKEVMSQIAQWSKLMPEFKLVVTSRPESDIAQSFTKLPMISLDLQADEFNLKSIQDVTAYIRYRFDTMVVESRPSNWPGEDVIQDLSHRSGGIFIWAVTALDFIEEFDPVNGLNIVQGGGAELRGVNTLYQQILETSFPSRAALTSFVTLMGAVVVAQRALSSSDYASLLGLEINTVRSICGKLRSVLDTDSVIQVKHASFVDYLVHGTAAEESPNAKSFRVDPDDGHRLLAESAFRVMNKELHFNICNVNSSFVSNATLGTSHFKRAIRPVLAYACQFWGHHLENTTIPVDVSMIRTFMCRNLLYWFEAMSGLEQSYFAFRSLDALERWLTNNFHGPDHALAVHDIKELAKDSSKFSRYFAPAIARSAPHVYVSAVPFTPKNSKVSELYSPNLRDVISLRLGQLLSWPPDSEWNVFRGHELDVLSVAFSPDGKYVVSGSTDEMVRVWERETGRTVVGPFKGHTGDVHSVVFSPDGRRIISGSGDKTIRVWDIDTGETIAGPFMGHDGAVVSIATTSDGKRVISASHDGTIRVWDIETGATVLGPLSGHSCDVESISLSPDNKCFASGSSDGTILIWELETGNIVAGPFYGHDGSILSICYSPNGNRLVSGSTDKTILVWDVRTGLIVSGPFTAHEGPVSSVAFHPNGKLVVSSSWDATIRVWDIVTGSTVAGSFSAHKDATTSVAFSVDGNSVVSGSVDCTIRVWEVGGGRLVPVLRNGTHIRDESLADSPVDEHAGSRPSEKMIRVWDIDLEESEAKRFAGHGSMINYVAFCPDGTRVVSGSSDTTIRIWDVQNEAADSIDLCGHDNVVNSATFSPDGKQIVSGSNDQTIRIWDVESRQTVVGPIEGHEDWISSVVFSPDGKRVVSGSADKTIRIWDTRTGELELELVGHENVVWSVAISPNGEFIASGSADKSVRVWNAVTGECVFGPLTGHSDVVMSVAFSPCGKYFASGSWDRTVRIWDTQTGRLVREPLMGHTHMIESVCFSPNGQYVASGSDDGTIRVWDFKTGEMVAGPFHGHSGGVSWIAFSPNSELIVSCSEDATVRLWDVGTIGKGVAIDTGILPTSDNRRKTGLFTDKCKRENDGWVIGENGELLFWIPPQHKSLRWPSNPRVLGEGETEIECDDVCWGEEWVHCYRQ